ncbi:hypothetical protein AMTR_s00099p00158360 [Amborella trichopoda]|uniref:RING-type E3 ubiquitin transferase n=1 Tax=Amborella trichopoda TaxID=13333 RepID=W1NS19_AMBTC|nr:hypothetical protein AMTR_s00099p00158360 [Amborella trichopoda]
MPPVPSSVAKQAELLKQDGNTFFKKDRLGAAIDAYTEAITLCPNVPVYWTNRALCHRKRNDWDRVEADCRRALELDASSVKEEASSFTPLLQLLNSLKMSVFSISIFVYNHPIIIGCAFRLEANTIFFLAQGLKLLILSLFPTAIPLSLTERVVIFRPVSRSSSIFSSPMVKTLIFLSFPSTCIFHNPIYVIFLVISLSPLNLFILPPLYTWVIQGLMPQK